MEDFEKGFEELRLANGGGKIRVVLIIPLVVKARNGLVDA